MPVQVCSFLESNKAHGTNYANQLLLHIFTLIGKGILAVDESTKTIGKRLESIGIENTEENRQAYRGLLFSAPGLGQYISGAILYEETLFQSSKEGKPFVDILKANGIFPGIKVDTGLQPLPGADPIETWYNILFPLLSY